MKFKELNDDGSLIDEELSRRGSDKSMKNRMKEEKIRMLKEEYASRKKEVSLNKEIRGLKASNRKLKFEKLYDITKKSKPVGKGIGKLASKFHNNVIKNINTNKREKGDRFGLSKEERFSKPTNKRRLI